MVLLPAVGGGAGWVFGGEVGLAGGVDDVSGVVDEGDVEGVEVGVGLEGGASEGDLEVGGGLGAVVWGGVLGEGEPD